MASKNNNLKIFIQKGEMLNFVLRWLTFWMSIHITNGSIVRDHLMIIHVQLGFNQKFNFGKKKKRHYVENYSKTFHTILISNGSVVSE